MSEDSFLPLLTLVREKLEIDRKMESLRGDAIYPEICLYACLRYLAGGSYSDIKYFTGMSVASLYRVVWKFIDAINACDKLAVKFPTTSDEGKEAAMGFEAKSTQGCIWNRASVIDGYHLQIPTPSKKDPFSVVIIKHMASTSRPHVIIVVTSPSLVLLDLE
jgi:hypothetical protein